MTGTLRIDLNADVGESLGPWRMGEDEALIPLVSSVNVACGAHAGDPAGIARTIGLAIEAGAAIGAHPGYPDLVGFGRRDLEMDPADLEASIIHQVGGVMALARARGVQLTHVKAHGALYNRAARDTPVAATIARAVRLVSADLVLVGLAGSHLLDAGRTEGLQVAAEAFADRAYEADGSLRRRSLPGALLADPAAAARQAVDIATLGRVRAHDGTILRVHADTLCLHGDTPGAAQIARAVRDALAAAGASVTPLARPPGAR
jgi:5-oxoprolinase (ATP-hydrolysing) subunit A